MVRTRVLAALLATFLAALAASPAGAEQWTSPDGAFTVELPEGRDWTVLKVPRSVVPSLPSDAMLTGRKTTDGRKAVNVTMVPNAPEGGLSPELITGFEKGLYEDNRDGKVSGDIVTVQGQPAYRYVARLPNGAWMGGLVAVQNRVIYNVQTVDADQDPFEDGELAAFMSSYRLR